MERGYPDLALNTLARGNFAGQGRCFFTDKIFEILGLGYVSVQHSGNPLSLLFYDKEAV